MNVLSTFGGIEGGLMALKELGVPVHAYYSSEIDPSCIKQTQLNFPEVIHLGDIRHVKASQLPEIDLLLGGSPCQTLSIGGDGSGFDGKSGLFFEFVRLLHTVRPKYFLLENVRPKKAEWAKAISDILGVGYTAINSNLFTGQNRLRYYWTNIPFDRDIQPSGITLSHIVGHSARGAALRNQLTKRGMEAQLNIRRDDYSNCLVASYHKKLNGVVVDGEFRPLTLAECCQLQGIPSWYRWHITEGQACKTLGNGWTIPVIMHILRYFKTNEWNKILLQSSRS